MGVLSRSTAGPRTYGLVALVLFVPALVWLTRSAQQTGDGLLYACSIRTGRDLFHPHHVLYVPIVRALYLAVGAVLPATAWDALAAAQLHGAAWATVAVAFFYLAARKLLAAPGLALLAALALLFSQGFWVLSTHAIPYVAAAGCLCCVLYLLVRRAPEPPGPGTWIAVSLVWALSILYHQVDLLLALPLVLYLLLSANGRRARRLACLLLPAGVVVAGVYVAAAAGGVVRYALRYALHPNPTWGTFRHAGPAGVAALLTNQAWALVALHRGLRPLVVLAVTTVAAAGVLWNVSRLRRPDPARAPRAFLLSWIVVYLAFYLWWLPQHKPFYVLTSVPLLLLIFLALDHGLRFAPRLGLRPAAATAMLGSVVGVVGAVHLVTLVLPLHSTQRAAYHEAESLERRIAPDAYVMAPYEVAQSLRYYFDHARSAHARFPLLCLYQDDPIPREFEIRPGERVVIDLDYLRPDRNLYGFDAYTRPERWLAYLDWVFRLEHDPSGAVIGARAVTAFRTVAGTVYLDLSPAPAPVAGLHDLLERLDRVGRELRGWTDRPFERWYERIYVRRAPRRAVPAHGRAGPAARSTP